MEAFSPYMIIQNIQDLDEKLEIDYRTRNSFERELIDSKIILYFVNYQLGRIIIMRNNFYHIEITYDLFNDIYTVNLIKQTTKQSEEKHSIKKYEDIVICLEEIKVKYMS